MRPFYVFASCLLPDRHLILQKRVITAFLTQRRQRTMAGNKGHIIAQRQQLFLDSRNQLPMVAARKIAASHPAFENHVSGDQQSGGVIKKTTWPGVWPGQCSTCSATFPTLTTSPSLSQRSGRSGWQSSSRTSGFAPVILPARTHPLFPDQ